MRLHQCGVVELAGFRIRSIHQPAFRARRLDDTDVRDGLVAFVKSLKPCDVESRAWNNQRASYGN
jgi:hypothetical protein